MAANGQGEDLQYQKPGAERSRRRRGEDDDLDSDLEEDLLEEDWLSAKKNASDASDEELNDDLLQSDDEDMPALSSHQVSLDTSFSVGEASYNQQQQEDYTDDVVDLGGKDFHAAGLEGEYADEFSQGDQVDYGVDMNDGLQDEVLDLQINEPLDGDFQDEEEEEYHTAYHQEGSPGGAEAQYQQGSPEEEGLQEQQERGVGEQESQEEEELADSSHLLDHEEGDTEMGEDPKEESDEEDEDDEESGRLRFKSERKDVTVVRIADAASKRRNIPETLELSEKAKADLMEYEVQERQRKQDRFGGGWGRGGRGYGRGSMQGFGGGQNFRGRGRMNEQRVPLIGHLGMQRLQAPLRLHPHHTQGGSRGPLSFQEHRGGGPLGHPPGLQPLMPPHLAHRSPPPQRPQLDSLQQQQRLLGSPPPPPPSFPQNAPPPQQGPAPQPKNIHINPHFRGPGSAQPAQQAPMAPSAQMQPRPGGAPQRFPGPGDFQQTGPFGQPQRPPPFLEPFRTPVAPPPPDREPFFIGEPRFQGQPMFDQQMNNLLMGGGGPQPSHRPPQEQQPPPQGHVGFGQPASVFNQTGPGPLGLFQREPPGAGLPPQGLGGLNQHGGPPNQPRPFMGPRQPFGQQQNQNLFTPPPFGMQGVMQLSHHEHMGSHPPQHHQSPHHHQQQQQHHQQQHRQDLPPHHHHHQQHHHQQQHNHQQQQQHHHPQHHQQQQHQLALSDHRPMMHQGQNPFQGGPRPMTPRHQAPPQRNGPVRQHMNAPAGKQHMQIPPQRNSNLRELPVAPGNNNNPTPAIAGNYARPGSGPAPGPASNIRPVARATAGARPAAAVGQGRGRPPAAMATGGEPLPAGRTVVRKEVPQDPDEDEETRQYRMKIEEQKRLREQVLRRKEMRRQMQAGVRKKELLERLNAQAPAPLPGQSPDPAGAQNQGLIQGPNQGQFQGPPQQQMTPPQAQRQFPFKQQQQGHVAPHQGPGFPPHQGPGFPPNQGPGFPPNGALQPPQLRMPVRPRLQPGMGGAGPNQQRQIPQLHQQQQQQQQHHQQSPQRMNSPQAFQQPGPPQRIMPIQGVSSAGPSPLQSLALGPKAGVKRTVMQRSRSLAGEEPQVPDKVRIVKLPGAHGRGAEPQDGPEPLTIPSLTQGAHRKVMQAGAMATQVGRGGGAGRVMVSGRGRARWAPSRGGRAAPSLLQAPESQACTVSIEGLSSSTTDAQLRNLLHSIGPIQMFKMLPQQRKALAKFSNPQHASSFQQSFNRHIIDLSHIDVSLIDG